MKLRVPAAIAMSLALSVATVPAAFAEASPFRSVEAQAFSDSDLARYGLTADEISQVEAYKAQGYEVQLLTAEEAEAYNAGLSNNNVLAIIGLVAIIVVIAAIV